MSAEEYCEILRPTNRALGDTAASNHQIE